MADDIDIEEHDVMDITNIKTEVIDYEEEYKYEEFTNENAVIKKEMNPNPVYNSNVIIFGTKPSTPQPCDLASTSDNNESLLVAVSNNKAVKSTSKGALKHFNRDNTKRPDLLCKHCNIFYPTKDDLIAHLNSLLAHNKELEDEESPHACSDTEPSYDKGMYLKCTICSAYYKYNENFNFHNILNHGDRFNLKRLKAPFNPNCLHCKSYSQTPKRYNSHLRTCHSSLFFLRNNYENGNYECHICKQNFRSAETEQRHRQQDHPTNIKMYNYQCKLALMSGKRIKNMNNMKTMKPHQSHKIQQNKTAKRAKLTTISPNNIVVTKSEPANSADDSIIVPQSHLYKCNKCQIHFISASAAFKHMNQCTAANKGDWKCQLCKRTFFMADQEMHNYQHKLFGRFRAIVISEEILPRVMNRCAKCKVCFDNETFSKYHSSGCEPCPTVECNVCNLQIISFAAQSHLSLHNKLGLKACDFIVTNYHKISKSFMPKNEPAPDLQEKKVKVKHNTVYYCSNCKLYVSRHRIQDGHEKGHCVKRNSARELCKLCGLVFSKKGIVTHKAYHKVFKIKLSTLTVLNILNGKRMIPPFPEFMLCSICQVNFVSEVALQSHICHTEEHKSCQYCYKKFSDLAFKLHLPFHQLTANAKRPHASKTTSNMEIIKKKRSLALKSKVIKNTAEIETRMPTPINDLIKKYESLVTVWNILYRCQTCDIVFDSYDYTVEHCQDHFCNMENFNLNFKYCKECNLKFVDICYGRHKLLHSQNSVDRDSFVIIDCNYSSLLSDEWQKVFNKLSKDQLHQVMSKSIYNEIRDVRMDLLCDGDLGSVYKCSLCTVSIDLEFIVEHVKNRDCDVNDVKFTCNVCSVGFSQKNAANAHVQKHDLSNVPYRIVTFNDPKNLYIDEALIRSAKVGDLKFIRCQYCGKLVNKSLYRMHKYKHNYSKKLKLLKIQSSKCKSSVVPSVKGKVSQNLPSKGGQKIIYRFHVCTNCNVALLRQNVHVCHENLNKTKCPICRVFIIASRLYRHKQMHKDYPTLSHKTIKINYFNPKEFKKNANNCIKPNQTTPAPIPDVVQKLALLRPSKKLMFLQCTRCTKCVMTKSLNSYNKHQCSGMERIFKCRLCGIKTDTRNHKNHLNKHKQIYFDKNDVIITAYDFVNKKIMGKPSLPGSAKPQPIEGANEARSTESYSDVVDKPDYIRMYKCTECTLFFVSRAHLVEHLGSPGACDRRACEKCEYCNLNFHSSEIKYHKTAQLCKTKKVSKIRVCTLRLKNTDPNNKNNWLSYCKKCDFYNTTALKRHFNTQHRTASKTVPCIKCGVRFASTCIKKHKVFHHGRVEVPFSDINVEVMEECSLEEAGYVTHDDTLSEDTTINSQLSVEENVLDKKNKITKQRDSTPIEHSSKIPDVYRCSVCNLHFNHRDSLNSHQTRDEHYAKRQPCKICGIPFSKISMKKHVNMHEYTDTFNIIEPERSNSRRGRWKSSNTSLNTSDTLDLEPTTSDDADPNDVRDERCGELSSNSKTAPTNQPSQSNLPAVLQKTREAADSSGTSSNEISSTNSISFASGSAAAKLFKCGECCVYFLTAECCSYHTVNHTPLDPTEYIACKICDLQFLNRSLDDHMKDHREKTFNMDTLVVDEYLPGGRVVARLMTD